MFLEDDEMIEECVENGGEEEEEDEGVKDEEKGYKKMEIDSIKSIV